MILSGGEEVGPGDGVTVGVATEGVGVIDGSRVAGGVEVPGHVILGEGGGSGVGVDEGLIVGTGVRYNVQDGIAVGVGEEDRVG